MFRIVAISIIFTFCGCARVPVLTQNTNMSEVIENICSIGQDTTAVQGDVWIRIESQEVNGQFPATVNVSGEGHLDLEVSNALGGVEALVKISPAHFELKVGDHPPKIKKGDGSWAGLPIRWATRLFRGQFPCPSKAERGTLKAERLPEDQIKFTTLSGDVFDFKFRSLGHEPWPERLGWHSSNQSVLFEFSRADGETMSPLQWEARSALGAIRVIWNERKAESSKPGTL